MIRCRTLGALDLRGAAAEEHVAVLSQAKRAALLVYLAVAAPRTFQRRDALVALFWPELDQEHARAALRQSLTFLRRELGDAVIRTRGGEEVGADPEQLWCDAAAFEEALHDAEPERALALYQGDFLPAFHVTGCGAFERWAEEKRGRLREHAADAATQLVARAEASGLMAEALHWAHRALAIQPDDERAFTRVMLLLDRSGDRAGALRVYEALVARLAAEYEMEPPPGVRQLAADIRSGRRLPSAGLAPQRADTVRQVALIRVDRSSPAADLPRQSARTGTASPGPPPTKTAPVARMPARPFLLPVARIAGVITVVAAGGLTYQLLRARPLTITASDLVQVTNEPGVEFQPAISPDGKDVAYVDGPISAPHLVIRGTANVASAGSVRLSDTALGSEWSPGWSANGQSVRFVGCPLNLAISGAGPDSCSWHETDRLGGAVRGSWVPSRSQAVAWSSDGGRIAFLRGDTIFTSSAADTLPRLVAVDTTFGTELAPHSLAWSPDGRFIAYVYGNSHWDVSANASPSSIWIVRATGGKPRRITTADCLNVSPAWLDARHLLFVSNRDGGRGLYVVEVGSGGARGEPRIVPGISDPHSVSYSPGAHELAWAKFSIRQNIWSYPLGGIGPVSMRDGRPVTTGDQAIEEHDVSPDGTWIVYDANLRGKMDLYVMRLPGGVPTPLTESSQDEEGPRWSPDGKEIAFYSWVDPSRSAVTVMPAGGGLPTRLTHGPGYNAHPAWSPNGLEIAFLLNRPGTVSTLWLVSRDRIAGPWHDARQLRATTCLVPDWAPDGRTLACEGEGLDLISPQDGRVLRRDIAAAGHLALQASGLRYSRDGKTLYAVGTSPDGRSGIWAIPVTGGQARLVIAADDPAFTSRGFFFSVGPDRLYVTVPEYESDIWVAKLHY